MVRQDIAAPATQRQPAVSLAFLRRTVKTLILAVLIAPVVAGAIVFASSTLPTLMGYGSLVVSSGSMSPTIKPGDALIVKPIASVQSILPGDVITYQPIDSDLSTTHRVVGVREIKGRTYYQTKGDAVKTVDPNLVSSETVKAKVLLKVPMVGYLLHYAGSRWGKVIVYGSPALLLMAWEISKLFKLARKSREDALEVATAASR